MRPPGQVSGLKGFVAGTREAQLVQPGDSCKVSVSIHWRHPPPKHHAAWTRHRKQVAIPRERHGHFRTLAHTVRTKPTPGSFSDLDDVQAPRLGRAREPAALYARTPSRRSRWSANWGHRKSMSSGQIDSALTPKGRPLLPYCLGPSPRPRLTQPAQIVEEGDRIRRPESGAPLTFTLIRPTIPAWTAAASC